MDEQVELFVVEETLLFTWKAFSWELQETKNKRSKTTRVFILTYRNHFRRL